MRSTGSKYRGAVGSERAEEESLRVYRTLSLYLCLRVWVSVIESVKRAKIFKKSA